MSENAPQELHNRWWWNRSSDKHPSSTPSTPTKYYHHRARPPLLLSFLLLLIFSLGVYVTSRFIESNFIVISGNIPSKAMIFTNQTPSTPPSVPQNEIIKERPSTLQIRERPETEVPIITPNTTIKVQPDTLQVPKRPNSEIPIMPPTEQPDTLQVPKKPQIGIPTYPPDEIPKEPLTKAQFPLNCSSNFLSCQRSYYPESFPNGDHRQPAATCPEYFRWIHEDLRPWNETGITKEMVERGRPTASFRLVVVNGTAYLEKYRKSFQSRDGFTIWGILQLLRRYPGKLPDLDLMFDCSDWPVVLKSNHRGPNATAPPPLFTYCRDDATLDLIFPDWSFWGWPEINIKPWEIVLKELEEGNRRKAWIDRDPHAYWKGNPIVAKTRMDLMRCNVSDTKDWGARIYAQDWIKESQQGYNQSDLARQCKHRFKIYIEGAGWSVSEKYILACNSPTLFVKPRYYDFFTRGLFPMQHYWPIKDYDKCKSIKFAVEWGNNHTEEAQEIGKAASGFIQEELKMDYVYDYMFHILSNYGSLLRYKPSVPRKAIQLCPERMACSMNGLTKKFMVDSMVNKPADKKPCTLAPPYNATSLASITTKKQNSEQQVDSWEKQYWQNQTTET